MTRDETVALFEACEAKRSEALVAALAGSKFEDEAGSIAHAIAHEAAKAHWNAWAEGLLAERKAMEASDTRKLRPASLFPSPWPVELEQGENAETQAWLDEAAADFSRCLFVLRGVELKKGSPNDDPPVNPIQLEGIVADFSGFIFPGIASFESVSFEGDAWFDSACFQGTARFDSAHFQGNASFEGADFQGNALFASASFQVSAKFDGARFRGNVWFDSACFQGYASFRSACFQRTAKFHSTRFQGNAWFEDVIFSSNAWFESATFSGTASFQSATFSGDASFDSATFSNKARFGSTTFEQDAYFQNAGFGYRATFALCNFKRYVTFEASRFANDAWFKAIRGERGFNMAGAVFEVVPDFIQAHFEEAPRLDNLRVGGKLPQLKELDERQRKALSPQQRLHRWGLERSSFYRRRTEAIAAESDLRNIPARWRALKRLAIQGHDTERELEFRAREAHSQRFAGHWPLPWPCLRADVWGSVLSFWFGVFYQVFSNFGRSLIRPAAFWIAAVVLGALFYVSQSPEIVTSRHEIEAKGASSIAAAASQAWRAWLGDRRPCHAGQEAPPKDKNGDTPVYVGALSPSLQSSTDLANEAWHLAFRNAFIVLDGSGEAAHRTYGCLYGVELYGGSNPLAVVPSAVSTVSAAQKLFSALMIFLFGLALRNMLKMK